MPSFPGLPNANPERDTILVTGATGYIGGRLVSALAGRTAATVRAMARQPRHLSSCVSGGAQVVQGDLLEPRTLPAALDGVHTAYYLVHSMGSGQDYASMDAEAAGNFRVAAEAAGAALIVYLGGLGDADSSLSPHLRSRQETGRILASGSIPVVELRASIVLGSGSLSFEMIRALCERLPVMITPRWVSTMAQPIAVEDLLAYLVECLDMEAEGHQIYEIGGPDQVSYSDLMQEYSRQRKLRRRMISVPLLSPRLSSLWLGLVTPLYARVGRALIQSIRNPTLVQDRSAEQVFAVRPMGVRKAIARALTNEDRETAQTRWSDAMSAGGTAPKRAAVRWGNRLIDYRTITVAAPLEAAFEPIERIGGRRGWYFATWLWIIRGWLDLLAGGVGMRRGRRHPDRLRPGDVLDCWRVEDIEPARLLRLKAEMKLPGRAWLQWELTEDASQQVVIHQTAIFDPVGILGIIYWYGIFLLHDLVFAGMLRGIARRAVAQP